MGLRAAGQALWARKGGPFGPLRDGSDQRSPLFRPVMVQMKFGCGDGIRNSDLEVMSLTAYAGCHVWPR